MPEEPGKPRPIVARIVFEIVGNPKDHVVKSLHTYLRSLKQDPEMKWSDEFVAEAEEHDGVWSTFAELTLTVKDLEKLTWLCVNFTPASIEILEPEEFAFTDKKATDWLNDMLSRLHEIGVSAKSLSSENELLKLNISHLVRNSILSALTHAKKPLTGKEIGSEIGIEGESVLAPFFAALEKEGRIKSANGEYSLA